VNRLAPRPTTVLVHQARRALALSRQGLGELLHVSSKTIARRETGESPVYSTELHELARLVHPRDPALGEELALAGGATPQALGLAPAPAPPPAPPPAAPPLPPRALVDAVVCAAAEALTATPQAVRSAVLAAFRRARELRMTTQDVEDALTPPTALESRPRPGGAKGANDRPGRTEPTSGTDATK